MSSTPRSRGCMRLRRWLLVGAMATLTLCELAPPLRAQVATTEITPRTTFDAARCLAIDNEIAELGVQLRNGTITAAERKQRADALTAERTRITTAYGARNSAPARGLLAEFNRLKAEAATEARERAAAANLAKKEAAAAELKAKREVQAAEAQAKRDAATAAAQAKKEAADAAAAEKARLAAAAEDALFAEVGQVADERLLRARDRFYTDFGLPSPTSSAQVAEQEKAAQALRAKNTPPAVPELRPPFDQRVEALVKLRLPERKNGWFAEVFPDPADITTAISGDTEQTAALELATRRLSEQTTGVRPQAAQAKLEAYQAARFNLKADFTRVRQLTQDKDFEAKVFARSLPAYSAQLQRQAEQERALARAAALRKRVNQLNNLIILIMLIAGAWLPIRLMRRQKFKWKRQSRADWEALMAKSPLPKDLWWIDVPGFSYPVTLFSGKIYDKEVWTETTVTTTTTTTPGTQYSYGYTQTSTSVSSTTYHRYWMITTEGAQTWHKYSDNEFIATIGQKVSSIWSDNYWVLLSYNHDVGSISFPKWWTKNMHRPPFWRIWAWTMLLWAGIATAGVATIMVTLGVRGDDLAGSAGDASKAFWAVFLTFGIGLLIYVSILCAIWTARRQSRFRKHYVPRFEAFLKGYNPVIPEVTKAG